MARSESFRGVTEFQVKSCRRRECFEGLFVHSFSLPIFFSLRVLFVCFPSEKPVDGPSQSQQIVGITRGDTGVSSLRLSERSVRGVMYLGEARSDADTSRPVN